MDSRLLRYYDRELAHLRAMGGEFAKEFPKIAGRLALDEFACQDPYVERLLEGFAFMASRVQLKLDAEFPRFTQSMLETIYPHYLSPTPSVSIIQFNPDLSEGGLAEGFTIPRDTALHSILGKGEQTRCQYRTAHDVTLWPIELVEAQYYTRELGTLGLPAGYQGQAGIQIRLQSTAGLSFNEINLDSLTLYLQGAGAIPIRIYEQIFAQCQGIIVQSASPVRSAGGMSYRFQKTITPSSIRQVGFEDEQRLLPYDARSFNGYRLLHEYFVFPQRFMFVELTGLNDAVQSCEEKQLDIIILLKEPNLELENVLNVSNFALYSTPAINLFPKRTDRIHVTDSYSEFHVVPDRTKPRDFEVYQIFGVTGFGTDLAQERDFMPFYAAQGLQTDKAPAYYTTNREPRTPSGREKKAGSRSATYTGSEVYISLVDAANTPYSADLRQLAVETLCTNRDLLLHMAVGQGRSDFTMELSAPYVSIRCLGAPSPPRPSYAEGEISWRAISHLTLNYLSLTDSDEHSGATALRDMLRLYGDAGELHIRKQIEGVKSVGCRSIVRRIKTRGPIAFAQGLEITLTFDESAFEGTGVFLLGVVLERFFAKYASINSFTETVIRTLQRGEVMRWPMRIGIRAVL